MENGALELDTIEASPLIEEGRVVSLIVKKKNRANFLIENFMIAANTTMVRFLDKQNIPYIQRVLPTPERWPKIREVAEELGKKLTLEPDSKALSEFLADRRKIEPLRFPDLSLTIVKLLGQAEYVVADPQKKKIGHFGLAVYDYTHSTAPNRRYVDIVIQRLIKSVFSGKPVSYNHKELKQIADWCTDRDRASKKVERFMRKVFGSVIMSGKIGQVFEAIVTGSSEKGTYVRLLEPQPPVEGRMMRGQWGMEIGDKVKVRLVALRPEKGYIDFERARR